MVFHPFLLSWVVKAASIAILAARAVRGQAWGLALALAFSALGDALLEFSPARFGAGLAAFLCAQILYALLFRREARPPKRKPAAALIIAYSLALAIWLVPAAGPLAIPVAIYIAAITAMAATAVIANFSTPWVRIGALLFVLSDSTLAINRFRTHVPFEGYIVWSTYYAAQLLITLGYLQSRRHAPRVQRAGAT